jgi:hypothetical protein
MHVKERSWGRTYDYNQVVQTQDDALVQMQKWQRLADIFSHGDRSWCRATAKVAYWRSVIEYQERHHVQLHD